MFDQLLMQGVKFTVSSKHKPLVGWCHDFNPIDLRVGSKMKKGIELKGQSLKIWS